MKSQPCPFLLATSHVFPCIWAGARWGPIQPWQRSPHGSHRNGMKLRPWSPSSPPSCSPEQQLEVLLGPQQPTRMPTSHSGESFQNTWGCLSSPASARTPHCRSCSRLLLSLRRASSVAFSTNAPFTWLPEKSLRVEICSPPCPPCTQGLLPAGGMTPVLVRLNQALHTLSWPETHLPPSPPVLQPKPHHTNLLSIWGAQCILPHLLPLHILCPLSGMPFPSASGRRFG